MNDNDSSIQVGPETVNRCIADPAFPYLVSFPRTGSHWLRMIMELYFETPSLVRIFYFKQATRFTCYHRHDEELDIIRQNVLYLYRHPVDTVYSQLNYYREDPFAAGRVEHWATLYGRHLHKWLLTDTFTAKKTVLTYEGMKRDLAGEFARVCAHFGASLDRPRLEEAARRVTREEVKNRTLHDPQVVNLSERYAQIKETFVAAWAGRIMALVAAVDPRLPGLFLGEKKR
jgi:hypothetical protein